MTKKVADVYPLTPLQHGMLYHTLVAPDSGVYVEQICCRLQGKLDIDVFEQTWQLLAARHTVLRTALVWRGVKEPCQVVGQRVKVPLRQQDWQEFDAIEQQHRLAAYLEEDHRQGFVLNKAPLVHLMLIRLAAQDYYFIFSFHHILMDGWSLTILFKEMFALYQAGCQGQQLELPPSYPYRNYIAWLQQQDSAAAQHYWRNALKGFLAPTPLPLTEDITPLPEMDYDERTLSLSTVETSGLIACARQHRLTLNTLTQAAWALLLNHYSGESDIVFGITVSGRPTSLTGIESMVGLFINTLPLRVKVDGKTTILSWLQDLQHQQAEMRQYEYSSLVEVQGWSEVPRGLPLFESILVFENIPIDTSMRQWRGELEIVEAKSFARTNYPITLAIIPDDKLLFKMEYNCRRFDTVAIDRTLTRLHTLLVAIAANPLQRIEEIPLIDSMEWQKLVVEWSGDNNIVKTDRCLHSLFEEQVSRTPNEIALICESEQLSYQELNARANQLAHHLRSKGITPDSLVGVCLERSIEMIVALLGILKAGGAYVPIDPGYPRERMAFMFEDANTKIILTQQRLRTGIASLGATIICLDSDWQEIATHSRENLDSINQPDNLAYVIYTSGSTGRPKASMISHASIASYAKTAMAAYQLKPGDRVLQFASISFDTSAEEIYPCLITGATLVLRTAAMLDSIDQFLNRCLIWGITVLDLPTAYWHELTLALNGKRQLPASLRLVIIGGEAALPDYLAQWQQKVGAQVRLVNTYGPTEATIVTTMQQLAPVTETKEQWKNVPIGCAIRGASVYLLNQNLQPVPVGVVGELHISGVGLARGYLNRPDITAEKFIPNPYSSQAGARLYRTGDLARYLEDGSIEYLGRTDHQVKLRGYRIELAEIESVLRQHNSVQECIVIAREDSIGDKRLVAYIVVVNAEQFTVSEMRQYLKQYLPEYMIPAAIVIMERLSLTPNGKLDRKALPAPDTALVERTPFVEPETELERKISAIWQEVLQIDQVGLHDNFFDLGGHSLQIIKVNSRLRDLLNRDLSFVELFQYPTVSTLAKHLSESQQQHKEKASKDRPERKKDTGKYPEIAIIGMAGSFPGAKDITQFWQNLRDGVESITFFSDEELAAAGIDKDLIKNPNYIKARGVIDDIELFDANFFGFNPREAEITDPQHRIFLERTWEALETAGYDSTTYAGRIGIFAGMLISSYLLQLYSNHEALGSYGKFQIAVGNDKDYLTTRVSYKLNLKGPSLNVQTACSTSLVAVHMACQSLINDECDIALAGGIAINVPQKIGYLYEEGGIASPDGHCRAFDSDAKGTNVGDGVGVVVLKRLTDAIADGDTIHAVIKGSAVNNDGAAKVGYAAPSVEGQAEVISLALAMAGVDAESISYVEAHGTATPMGDPIEVTALTKAFRTSTNATGFCALGSVKTNIGHLDAAAGVAGLIKTVLSLKEQMLPASLNFHQPNPNIDFANSPFYVNNRLKPWP
ncbi:MAG: amino acid adenylation domain-containing protein, partial [Acidobacteriota bacterium]